MSLNDIHRNVPAIICFKSCKEDTIYLNILAPFSPILTVPPPASQPSAPLAGARMAPKEGSAFKADPSDGTPPPNLPPGKAGSCFGLVLYVTP